MDVDPPAESSKRRATRTATKKRKADKVESDVISSSAPKKPRITKKQGRLAGLLSISLDVVFEIFGNLQPLDVLRLSRTSKEFRELLMHKSSRSIWRSSLNNVKDLPPCPPNMTEPQWISLAFDPVCQVCQKIARKVDWDLYIRICGKCAKTCLEHRISGLLPRNAEPQAVDFIALIPTRSDTSRPYRMMYFPPELEKVKTACNAIEDAEEKQKFVEERKELIKTLAELTKLCKTWSEAVADDRSAELADRKEERYHGVITRLTALGWGTEIDHILPLDSLRRHPLVKLPNALTDRTWNTIKADMIKYMEQMKAKRLRREYDALVEVRKAIATNVLRTFKRSQLPWNAVMPGALEFCEFPKIKEIIVQPSSVTVDEQTFEALLPDFLGMIATWREGLVGHIVKVYKRDHDQGTTYDDDIAAERIKLATSVFKCTSCGGGSDVYFDDLMGFGNQAEVTKGCRPLFYPNVLAHRCLTRMTDLSMAMMFLTSMAASTNTPWRATTLRLDTRTAEMVEEVIRACGMDPETTTVEDMDARDPRLACHVCAERGATAASVESAASGASVSKDKGKGKAPATAEELESAKVVARDWRGAVRHHGEKHWHLPTAWYMLSDTDAAAARVQEAVVIETSNQRSKALVQGSSDGGTDSGNDVDMLDEDGPATPTSENKDPDEQTQEARADISTTVASPGRVLPSQLPEATFSCAHCIDTPREPQPMDLKTMFLHLRGRHKDLTPRLNDNYYRSLAAPEIYTGDPFPAPVLNGVMIAAKPDLPDPPPRKSFLEHYLYDSDYGSDDDGYGYDEYGVFPW